MRWPLRADELGVMREGAQRQVDVVLRPHEQRDALMQLGRLDVEHARLPVDRRAAGLLADERQWIGLVEEPQLPLWTLLARRIAEHAAAEQVAMEVGDERADVAHREWPSVALEPAVLAHELLGGFVPVL